MSIKISGLFGFLILIADVWAILNIVQSKAETFTKLIWVVVILLLPVLGLIIWWMFGPRET